MAWCSTPTTYAGVCTLDRGARQVRCLPQASSGPGALHKRWKGCAQIPRWERDWRAQSGRDVGMAQTTPGLNAFSHTHLCPGSNLARLSSHGSNLPIWSRQSARFPPRPSIPRDRIRRVGMQLSSPLRARHLAGRSVRASRTKQLVLLGLLSPASLPCAAASPRERGPQRERRCSSGDQRGPGPLRPGPHRTCPPQGG